MVKNEMTAQNLRSAFGGESQAYQRYLVWGEKAEQEGFSNVALLFKAIAYAEQVHAGNHFRALDNIAGDFLVAAGAGFGLGSTSKNLEGAIAGENFEIEQMYPAFQAVADAQEEKAAKRTFYFAVEAEKNHADLYRAAKEAVDAGSDFDLEYVSVCDVCGHTVKDHSPEKCPICGAPHARFTEFGKE